MSLALRILKAGLARAVRVGSLELVAADGARLVVGDGTPPSVVARLTDRRAAWGLALDPEMALGELYTDGRLILDRGTIYDFGALVMQRGRRRKGVWAAVGLADRLRAALRRYAGRIDPGRARRNVAHHYDLGDDLYALFLDPDWQYSCAYFEHPGQSLADAQRAKQRHLAAKLRLAPGQRVLDIGCGWGGLARYLAAAGAEVLGITLSEEQLARARRLSDERGLADRTSFELIDYRRVEGRFDRIVSVGMFEHVGLRHYREFFDTCRRLLTLDGVMLLHTIGCADAPRPTSPWLTRHIFPGGHLPSLSDIVAAAEQARLIVTDVEVLRLHYAETLAAWRANFLARRAEAAAMHDERFCRMWEFYLAMSELAFRHDRLVVFQLQLARRQEAVPLTRGYVDAEEARLRRAEVAGHPSVPSTPVLVGDH